MVVDEVLVDFTVRGNSLYRNGEVIQFEDSDELLLIREPIVYEGTVNDSYYMVEYEDRLDLIAYRYYKAFVEDSSKYWWVIADANNIVNPLDLSTLVGTEIIIPNILNILLQLQ